MPKYKEEQESRYISRTVAILSELPEFCTVFYDKNQTTFLLKTQYDYMRAMRSFLTYQQQSMFTEPNSDLHGLQCLRH